QQVNETFEIIEPDAPLTQSLSYNQIIGNFDTNKAIEPQKLTQDKKISFQPQFLSLVEEKNNKLLTLENDNNGTLRLSDIDTGKEIKKEENILYTKFIDNENLLFLKRNEGIYKHNFNGNKTTFVERTLSSESLANIVFVNNDEFFFIQ